MINELDSYFFLLPMVDPTPCPCAHVSEVGGVFFLTDGLRFVPLPPSLLLTPPIEGRDFKARQILAQREERQTSTGQKIRQSAKVECENYFSVIMICFSESAVWNLPQ